MTAKKITAAFLAVFAAAFLYAAFQSAVDPSGAFGDRFLNWYDYDMTENSGIAKIAYLDKNHDKYNSYILGSENTGSYSVSSLNRCFGDGASFYNLFTDGGIYAARHIAEYVIENYDVKNIVLNIEPEDAVSFGADGAKLHAKAAGASRTLFYLKSAFASPSRAVKKLKAYARREYLPTAESRVDSETGAYSADSRDVENVGSEAKYLEAHPEFNEPLAGAELAYTDECVRAVAEIKEMCDLRGISFTLIASPSYCAVTRSLNAEQLRDFYTKLASVTDFYDFSGYTDISFDSRYYYDREHPRSCVGDMVLAYISGDDSVYKPDNFGCVTTAENVAEHTAARFTEPLERLDTALYTKSVPVLMYHHLMVEDNDNDMAISPALFESHLQTIRANGFTPISFAELENYVLAGAELPEKPVIITFDDGYLSNYEYAYPLLKEYGMKATIFVVGVTMGASTYKDTGVEIYPHFDYSQAKEMADSGVIELGSHTYDLHRSEDMDEEYRFGASKLEGETDREFAKIFTDDIGRSISEIKENTNYTVTAFSYPQGAHTALTDLCAAKKLGIKATVTVSNDSNTVIKGIPQSMYLMNRFGMYKFITPEDMLRELNL